MGPRHRARSRPARELGIGRPSARGKAALPRDLVRARQDRGGMTVEQAIFLVGGLGTRLRSLTAGAAKPVLEVGGKPFLDHLLDEASRHGLRRALLLCG